MLSIEFKTYRIGKKIGRDYCEDSVAVNGDALRFAVADGVSNSFRPELVSKYLVDNFVDLEIPVADWVEHLATGLGDELEQTWREGVRLFLDGFAGFGREIQEGRLQSVGAGASTFCGAALNLESGYIDYAVLGDSCLFVLPDDGPSQVFTTCPWRMGENGLEVDFQSGTSCIVADRRLPADYEDWRVGRRELRPGYVALMTDGIAKWFVNMALAQDPEAPRQLWEIADRPDLLTHFVRLCRSESTPLSDDLTLILIKVTEAADQETPSPVEDQTATVVVKQSTEPEAERDEEPEEEPEAGRDEEPEAESEPDATSERRDMGEVKLIAQRSVVPDPLDIINSIECDDLWL